MLPFKYAEKFLNYLALAAIVGIVIAIATYPSLSIKTSSDWALYFRYYTTLGFAIVALPTALIGRFLYPKNAPVSKSEQEWRNAKPRYRARIYLFNTSALICGAIAGWIIGGILCLTFRIYS